MWLINMAMPHFFILKHQSQLISNLGEKGNYINWNHRLFFPIKVLTCSSAPPSHFLICFAVSFIHAPWQFTFHSPSKGCVDVYVCATRDVRCHENFLRCWSYLEQFPLTFTHFILFWMTKNLFAFHFGIHIVACVHTQHDWWVYQK